MDGPVGAVRGVDHFLFAHPGHQEELEQKNLVGIAFGKELVEDFLLVDFRLFLDVLRPVVGPDFKRLASDVEMF